jgi:hypothetical protein
MLVWTAKRTAELRRNFPAKLSANAVKTSTVRDGPRRNKRRRLAPLIGRLEARTEEATELRIRLELTEKGQSTLEDDLAEERRSLSHNTMARLSASPNLNTG